MGKQKSFIKIPSLLPSLRDIRFSSSLRISMSDSRINNRIAELEKEVKRLRNTANCLRTDIETTQQQHSETLAKEETANQQRRASSNLTPLKGAPANRQDVSNGRDSWKPKWLVGFRLMKGLQALGIIAGIVYTFVAFFQWRVMQDSFDAANKPSIGIEGYGISFLGPPENRGGPPTMSARKTPESNMLVFTMSIKNFGSVVGDNTLVYIRAFVNGKELRPLPQNLNGILPEPMWPGQTKLFPGNLKGSDYFAVMNGTETFDIQVSISYDGPHKHYEHCEVSRWMNEYNTFQSKGRCDPSFNP